jgi:alpha-galactosidase
MAPAFAASCCLAALGLAAAEPSSSRFPAGWNGLAATPPLAWRSYNAQVEGTVLSQQTMQANIEALVSRDRTVDGKLTSLWDLGFRTAGIDGGWDLCVNVTDQDGDTKKTYHDPTGKPMINTQVFPDMKGLVDFSHERDIKLGWYQNICSCHEKEALTRNYEGDITALHELGFDGVKYDRCNVQLNSTLYAELMNATGKSFLIEQCHWGICTDDDTSSCPTPSRDWCPFNFFRTSGDVRETWNSWARNLMTTLPFLDESDPLSGPSCWAYPDMLQVGNLATFEHDRAHLGSWAIISAPLYLSFDLRDSARMDRSWPLISNAEVLAVNQAWAGHPGRLVKAWTPASPPTQHFAVSADLHSCQTGWSFDTSTGQVALNQSDCSTEICGCLTVPPASATHPPLCPAHGGSTMHTNGSYCDDATLTLQPCDASDVAQRFTFTGSSSTPGFLSSNLSGTPLFVRPMPWWQAAGVSLTTQWQHVFFSHGSFASCNTSLPSCSPAVFSQSLPNEFAGATCINASPTFSDAEALLLWAKPLPNDTVAALLVNNHHQNTYTDVAVATREVGLPVAEGQEVHVRDLWARKDLGSSHGGALRLDVPPRDSHFVLLSPA